MEKKLTTVLFCSVLVLAFGILSALVVVSRRNPFFIEKKLRLGALLLSLSGSAAGCGCTTCYDPAPVNVLAIDNYDYAANTLSVTPADTITGVITYRRDQPFSFMITDSSGIVYLKDNILPADGAYDEATEEFAIVLPASITPGTYRLDLSPLPVDSIENTDYYRDSYNLVVTGNSTP